MGPNGVEKVNEGTSFQPSKPIPCANGCGFSGTPATMNLCSKCYRDFRMKEQQETAAKIAFHKLVSPAAAVVDPKPSSSSAGSEPAEMKEDKAAEAVGGVSKKASNRCSSCQKKVGVLGFTCRCGSTFCGVHRYPEKHDCEFDFKTQGREAIAMANPVVKGAKIQRF